MVMRMADLPSRRTADGLAASGQHGRILLHRKMMSISPRLKRLTSRCCKERGLAEFLGAGLAPAVSFD